MKRQKDAANFRVQKQNCNQS